MKRFLSLIPLLAVGGYAGASELVKNGGFETGNFSGWTVGGDDPTGGVVIPFDAHSGTHSAFLTPAMGLTAGFTMTQTLATTIGQKYLVSIWALGLGNQFSSTDFLDASFGGNFIFEDVPSDIQWHRYTATITATSKSTDLFIHAGPDRQGGSIIDDISVTTVPEPASLSALALGVVAMLRRRRA